MIRNLSPYIVTERSVLQTQTDYRTMETVITANGRPIVACSTKQEAQDMLTYLDDRKPRRTANTANIPSPSIEDIFGV
jgi:hypothetical protein